MAPPRVGLTSSLSKNGKKIIKRVSPRPFILGSGEGEEVSDTETVIRPSVRGMAEAVIGQRWRWLVAGGAAEEGKACEELAAEES
ncbi:hypothetical protein V6Z11_D10G122300 [Gossypium hirsutum]